MNATLPGDNAQNVLNQIILNYQKEQRRKHRTRIFWRILLVFIIAYGIYLWYAPEAQTKAHVGLVDLRGNIADNQEGNADDFAESIEAAYKAEHLKALIVRINSPGGSPVQAEYIYNTLHYYRKKFPAVKIYAVCTDLCASAAYYVAAAADEIYASPASMVGSIGVVYNGFGFVDAMQKIGVSRRLQVAGKNKGFLDPFSPTDTEQQQTLQTMLDIVHQLFISRVKEGRGKRLKINDSIFSGLLWTGEQARSLGLIDGFASAGQLARDVIKEGPIVEYTYKGSALERVGKNLGLSVANQLPEAFVGAMSQQKWRT